MALSMTAGAVRSAWAQFLPSQIDLHGFGSWAYRRTNTNDYLGGIPEGSYRNVNFALNVAAAVQTSLTIRGQVHFAQDQSAHHVDLDYVFAEWRVSDAVKLRAGKMQHPFGIYSEVFRVGTIRPFLSLPQSVYGPTGSISEAAEGLGLRGTIPAGHGWDVQYDVYAGGIDVPENDSSVNRAQGLPPEAGGRALESEVVRDVVGARINLRTPIPGFRFGVSSYTGVVTPDSVALRKTVVGAHAEYLTDLWWLRSEFVHEVEDHGRERTNAFYVEAARFLSTKWQVAAKYGILVVSSPPPLDLPIPSFLRHREVGLGVNYWFAPEFVLKSSIFFVNGNRFAEAPVADATSIDRNTRLVQLGAEFSF